MNAANCRDFRPLSAPALLLAVMIGGVGLALNHHYLGLFHDSRLYLLQALSHLQPESLGQDVFLRYGSQDAYTLFTLPLALLVRAIGAEHAAALLTCVSQLALLAAAGCLARSLTPALPAILGVAVLACIRGSYGAQGVFTLLEGFLTPRMAAEALVLLSLAALVRQRPRAAVLALAAAALCHPLMAMAGGVALAAWTLAIPRPLAAAVAACVAAVALIFAARWFPVGPLARFDPDWYLLVSHRSPYLFLGNWTPWDWSRLAPAVATLALGAAWLALPSARRLAAAVLMTLLAGMLLTAVACDGLQLVRVTQLQPWRWQWLGLAVAAVLLPAVLHAAWREGAALRPSALLLAAVWVFDDYPGGIPVALLAVGLPWLLQGRPAAILTLAWRGALAVLGIACLWRGASDLLFTSALVLDSDWPPAIRRLFGLTADGTLLLAALLVACRADDWPAWSRRGALLALGLACGGACLAVLPLTLRHLAAQEYTAAYRDSLAPFRAAIPPGTAVLWDGPAVAAWLLLDRPNYLVPADTAGMLFSHAAALEMQRRARVLGVALSPDMFLRFEAPLELRASAQQLQAVCRTGEVPFIVSWQDLGSEPVRRVPAGQPGAGLRLYRCEREVAAVQIIDRRAQGREVA
jgi:hypothetical protein